MWHRGVEGDGVPYESLLYQRVYTHLESLRVFANQRVYTLLESHESLLTSVFILTWSLTNTNLKRFTAWFWSHDLNSARIDLIVQAMLLV